MARKFIGIHMRMHDEAYQASITIIDTNTGTDVVRDKVVDLYSSTADYTSGVYDQCTFWWVLLDSSRIYDIQVANAGAVAGRTYGATPAAGVVEVESFVLCNEIEDSDIQNKLISAEIIMYSKDYPENIYRQDINLNQQNQDITKISKFDGDGTTKLFGIISSDERASKFLEWSSDGGVTWNSTYSSDITFGTNDPFYNDRLIVNGHFYVNFAYPPSIGSRNVQIRWKVLADTAKIKTKFNLVGQQETNVRVTDYAAEFI